MNVVLIYEAAAPSYEGAAAFSFGIMDHHT